MTTRYNLRRETRRGCNKLSVDVTNVGGQCRAIRDIPAIHLKTCSPDGGRSGTSCVRAHSHILRSTRVIRATNGGTPYFEIVSRRPDTPRKHCGQRSNYCKTRTTSFIKRSAGCCAKSVSASMKACYGGFWIDTPAPCREPCCVMPSNDCRRRHRKNICTDARTRRKLRSIGLVGEEKNQRQKNGRHRREVEPSASEREATVLSLSRGPATIIKRSSSFLLFLIWGCTLCKILECCCWPST